MMVPPVGADNFGITPPNCTRKHVPTKLSFLFYKERFLFGTPLNSEDTRQECQNRRWVLNPNILSCIHFKPE